MTGQLILVRHAAISQQYSGRCYGRSDIELSEAGESLSRELCNILAAWPITRVVHSGLQRTRFLADQLADQVGCRPECCEALLERDFGEWELKEWRELYDSYGDEMTRMISDPQTYRPGGGETTFEMRDRVLQWFHTLPRCELTVAVSHGGPIAALRGARKGLPVTEWLSLIPAYGEYCSMNLADVDPG